MVQRGGAGGGRRGGRRKFTGQRGQSQKLPSPTGGSHPRKGEKPKPVGVSEKREKMMERRRARGRQTSTKKVKIKKARPAPSQALRQIARYKYQLETASAPADIKNLIVNQVRQKRVKEAKKDPSYWPDADGMELVNNSFIGGLTREGFEAMHGYYRKLFSDYLLVGKSFREWGNVDRRKLLNRKERLLNAFRVFEEEINNARTLAGRRNPFVERVCTGMHNRIRSVRDIINNEVSPLMTL